MNQYKTAKAVIVHIDKAMLLKYNILCYVVTISHIDFERSLLMINADCENR